MFLHPFAYKARQYSIVSESNIIESYRISTGVLKYIRSCTYFSEVVYLFSNIVHIQGVGSKFSVYTSRRVYPLHPSPFVLKFRNGPGVGCTGVEIATLLGLGINSMLWA